MKNIKEILEAAKADKCTINNDVRVTNVSIYVAVKENVDYWATITLDSPVPDMIAERGANANDVTYKAGLSKTVTTPLGTLVTLLFDYLIEQDDDDCIDLCDYKSIIFADAEKEAKATKAAPYTSHLHRLLNATKINVITRPVEKGKKYTSYFSLNDKERQAENDGFWHDLYGLANVRTSKIAEALKFAIDTNSTNANADANTQKQSAYDALMAAINGNSANAAVANALA